MHRELKKFGTSALVQTSIMQHPKHELLQLMIQSKDSGRKKPRKRKELLVKTSSWVLLKDNAWMVLTKIQIALLIKNLRHTVLEEEDVQNLY